MKNNTVGVGCLVSWVPLERRDKRLHRKYGIVVESHTIHDYASAYTLIKVRGNDGKITTLDRREVHLHGHFATA